MNDEAEDLRGQLAELAGETLRRQGPGSHPSLESLTAHHAGELPPAAGDEIQEHLAVCRHCAGLLLDLSAFLEAPAEGLDGGETEADAAWQEIRERLPGPAARPETSAGQRESRPADRFPRPSSHPFPPRRRLLRLAAAALVALAVAPLWVIAWRLATPSLPPSTVDLSPIETQRGATEPPPSPPAIVHAAAASTTLILRLAREQPDLRFTLELRRTGSGAGSGAAGSGGRTDLPPPRVIDPRTLLLVLERHRLAPGQYRLRVLDADRPSAEPLADYALDVVEP